jgi:hypothetical protein
MGVSERKRPRRCGNTPGPGPQPLKEATVDTTSIRTPSTEGEAKLAKLEERYRHELMDDEERQELRERILRIRRRLSERS